MRGKSNRKKIKIFLGGYVNFPNAQNINCDNIARYLDKDKFEVHTMYGVRLFGHKMQPVDKRFYREQKIHLHPVIGHRFIWYWNRWLMMYFGKYDVYYLPKMESVDTAYAKRFKGRRGRFTASVEGVIGEQVASDDYQIRDYLESTDGCFSISKCILESAEREWSFKTELLYLGVLPPVASQRSRNSVKELLWVGSIIERKRPDYLLACAKRFPQLRFTMIGDGDMLEAVRKRLESEKIKNVSLTGRIPNQEVYRYMDKADLLLMTSDKEGLPKVIGEGMSMGVPAIYINQCYEADNIQSGVNGFAVSNLEEMCAKLQYLLDHPAEYQKMSAAAVESIQPYLWPALIKEYEDFFENVARK